MRHLKIKTFKLLGKQVQHSLSPLIHTLFAQQAGLQISYDLLQLEPAQASTAITTFFSSGGCGMNITAPYKEFVFNQMQNVTPAAKVAKAVNTIFLQADGTVCGENTDGVGFDHDLIRNDIQVTARNIIILGAGGAVRGILPQLLRLQPKAITIFNRDMQKAELVRRDFAENNIQISPYSELHSYHSDLIIHAISSKNDVLPLYSKINFANTICYDLNYGPNSSIFLSLAASNGVKQMINGLGMLVAQAAEAFNLWHNYTPEIAPVLAEIQRFSHKNP